MRSTCLEVLIIMTVVIVFRVFPPSPQGQDLHRTARRETEAEGHFRFGGLP